MYLGNTGVFGILLDLYFLPRTVVGAGLQHHHSDSSSQKSHQWEQGKLLCYCFLLIYCSEFAGILAARTENPSELSLI